jgi:hypothetical protein
MNAAALFRQIIALRPKPKALTKEWDHAKAAEADVTILDSNGQPLLPTISVTPLPTVFQFGGGIGGGSKNNGNDNLRANYVLGVGAKRNGDDVRAMSKHADFLIKFVEQKFATPVLGFEVIHRAAGHKKAQMEAHKWQKAKQRKDQQYLVVRAIEKHWRNRESDIAVALKTLGGVVWRVLVRF